MLLKSKKEALEKDMDEFRRLAKDEMEFIRQRSRRISFCIKDCKRSRVQLQKITSTYKDMYLQSQDGGRDVINEVKAKLTNPDRTRSC